MNEPNLEQPIADATAECCAEMDEYVRRNPGTAILLAVGAGLAIGLLVRAFRPEPTPRSRVAQMLEDLEERLREHAEPVMRKASSLASDGASALQEGLHSGEARIGRLFRDSLKRLRNFRS